jgi:hypothetical protein
VVLILDFPYPKQIRGGQNPIIYPLSDANKPKVTITPLVLHPVT